jgi:hypothetical protein
MRVTGKQPGQGYADALFIAAAVNAARAWIDQGVELASSPDLAELRSFEAAATPGPWTLHTNEAHAALLVTEAGTFPYNVVAHRGFTSAGAGHHDTAMAYLAAEHARNVLATPLTMALDEFLATYPPRPSLTWPEAFDRLWSQRRAAMDMLANSMAEGGQDEPVRICSDGWVYDGLMRVAVADTLGFTTITFVIGDN